jgi:hypothetical protein
MLHAYQRSPLKMQVSSAGKPAANKVLTGCLAYCCGACCGKLGTTDAQGMIRVSDFYPEEWDQLYFYLNPEAGDPGPILWKGQPMVNQGEVIVELSQTIGSK